jgi:hypothetical protein
MNRGRRAAFVAGAVVVAGAAVAAGAALQSRAITRFYAQLCAALSPSPPG